MALTRAQLIAGNIQVAGPLSADNFIPVSSSVPTNGLYLPATNEVGIATNSNGRLFIDADGNIGIGTNDPGKLLHLVGATNTGIRIADNTGTYTDLQYDDNGFNSDFIINADAANQASNSTLQVHLDNIERLRINTSEVVFNDTGADYNFRIEGDNNPNLLFIDAGNDRIGIGTNGPNDDLEIRDTVAALRLTDSDTNAFTRIVQDFLTTRIENTGEGDIRFSNFGSERIRITSTGTFQFIGAGTAGTSQAVSFNGSAPSNSLVIDSNGNISANAAASSVTNFYLGGDLTGGTNTFGLRAIQEVQADSTGTARPISTSISTADNSGTGYTISQIRHFEAIQGTFHADSTVTAQTGFRVNASVAGAAQNYGFISDIDAAAGKTNFNFYALGDAPNYFAGNVGIGTTSPDELLHVELASTDTASVKLENTDGFHIFKENNGNLTIADSTSDRIRLDASGRLLVGTSTATENADRLTGNKIALVDEGTGRYPSVVITSYAGANASTIPIIDLQKSRGSTDGSMTIVDATDDLGAIQFLGSNGASFVRAASILAEVDGTPAGPTPGPTTVPGRLTFSTTEQGNGSPTPRMTIKSDGKVGIGQTSPGALLDVNGDALINGVTIGKGTGSLTGNTAFGFQVLGVATTGGVENTGVGYYALQDLTTGINNTAIGSVAGVNLTDGDGNTFVGRASGYSTLTGSNNSAFGTYALQENTTGINNIAIGSLALNKNVTGNYGVAVGYNSQRYADDNANGWTNTNTSVGFQSLMGSTTPADNTGLGCTAVGYNALQGRTSGNNNTGIGGAALAFTTTGGANTAVGYNALVSNTTGNNNTALGYQAMQTNVAGQHGVALGLQSQFYVNNQATTWTNTNTSVGYQSLRGSTTAANNTGVGNTVIGHQSMYDNTSGSSNTAVGYLTLSNNTTGNSNVAVGVQCLASNTIGQANVAIGNLTINTSYVVDNCTAIGHESQRYVDTTADNKDANNTSVGYRALRGSTTPANNTGTNNTAVGYNVLLLNTSGSQNIGVGTSALATNTSGNSNTAIGLNALLRNTTGIENSALGHNAGRFEQDGSDNANFDNCTYLGHDTRASGNNQVILGDSNSDAYLSSGTTQVTSDERDKADIRDTILGLEFINALRPVDYRWDPRVDYFDKEVYQEEETETVEVPNPAYLAPQLNPAFEPGGDEPEYIGGNDEPEFIEETRTRMVTKDRLVPVPKDGSRKRTRFHHGLIAQEVKATMDSMGVDFAGYQDHKINGGNDKLTMGYTELIAPLIKAVQELTAENAALKARLDAAGL